ncbi:MAG: hypothetical protein AB7T49_17930 [Oligoflexales bacterium]
MDAKRARISLASRISAYYLPNEKIESIAVSGSTARGGVDDWSDLELAVFWRDPPTMEDRDIPLSKMKAVVSRQITPKNEFLWGVDNFVLGQFPIDVVHNMSTVFQKTLCEIVPKKIVEPKKQELAYISQSFEPIFGHLSLEKLKLSLGGFSSEYQQCVLEQIKFPTIGVIRTSAARGDFMHVYRNLLQGNTEILKVLCAVNGMFYPGEKRTRWLLNQFEISPANLEEKMMSLMRGDLLESCELLHTLFEETINIVAANTEFDVQPFRAALTRSRRSMISPSDIDQILI